MRGPNANWRPARAVAGVALTIAVTACSTGYCPRCLSERQVLEDLRAIRLDAAVLPAPGPSGAGGVRPVDAKAGLSLEEAVAVGLYANPDLRAFRMERGVAEGELVTAGLLENPTLDFEWLHIPEFTRSFSTGAVNLGLSWQPPRPGERDAKRAAACAHLDEVRDEIAGEEWRVATEVRRAYVSLAGAQERLRLADLALSARAKVRDVVRRQVENGVASRLDGSLAEVEYASVLREREVLAGEREAAGQTLARVLGLPPTATVGLRGGAAVLAYRTVALDPLPLEDRMITARPDLRAAKHGYERAEQELRLACIQSLPALHFGPAYERDGSKGEGVVDKLGLGVGLELPIANRNQGEIAKKYAERDKKAEEFRAKLHAARAELNEAARAAASEARILRLYETTLEPAYAENEKILAAGLEAKELDVFRYLASEEKSLEGRRAHVEALERYWRAVFDLERAVGARAAPSSGP